MIHTQITARMPKIVTTPTHAREHRAARCRPVCVGFTAWLDGFAGDVAGALVVELFLLARRAECAFVPARALQWRRSVLRRCGQLPGQMGNVAAVLAQMWPQSWYRCARVPAQMWPQSWYRCGRVPAQMSDGRCRRTLACTRRPFRRSTGGTAASGTGRRSAGPRRSCPSLCVAVCGRKSRSVRGMALKTVGVPWSTHRAPWVYP
jgi:hypothetical protein